MHVGGFVVLEVEECCPPGHDKESVFAVAYVFEWLESCNGYLSNL